MPKQNVYQHSFATGVVDKKNLPRVDLERMRLAAEDQTNYLATTTGNMFLRPGLPWIAPTRNNLPGGLKEFIVSDVDGMALEFTASRMRVIVDDTPLSRVAVSTQIQHPQFDDDAGWQLTATDGATSEISGGKLRLTATALGSKAVAKQQVSVSGVDIGKEHALRIVVDLGPVTFRCGTIASADDYISETQLIEGTHSLAFTPTTDKFWVRFQTTSETPRRVSSCSIEDAGIVEIPTVWGSADVGNMRFAQSADVMFVACEGKQQARIERRSRHSWSVVKYWSDKGPFMADRSAPVRLKPDETRGVTTLRASDDFFTPDHVGALFKLTHSGQVIQQSLADDQVKTDPIKVTGVYNITDTIGDRDWTYTITGTWSTTLQTERSVDSDTFGFRPYRRAQDDNDVPITTNVADVVQTDQDDNAIIYYRIGFADGYTSGVANIVINYDGGGGYGICRVTQYIDPQTVQVQVIVPFKNIVYTSDWLEGQWSPKRGYPSSVALSEGRLFWAGNDKFWGSVSDAYDDFDETTEGDSGPINRSIAIGTVNQAQWMLPMQRLVIGTNAIEVTVKSTTLDEPLSPTNLSLKESSSSVGSAPVEPVKIGSNGIFVGRTGKALFELNYTSDQNDYSSSELTRLCASFFESGVAQLAVSKLPDRRIWAVMGDGSCMCILYQPDQQVVAFIPLTTDGEFKSVCVIPGPDQDKVIFIVKRTVNGTDYHYIEKMAPDAGATIAQGIVMDSSISGTNSPASVTIGGLSHLIGRQVKVWADGAPVLNADKTPKLFAVSNAGTITLDAAVSSYVVGLGYRARYKSARLAYGAMRGTAMIQRKKVSNMGLILHDFVVPGFKFGAMTKRKEVLFPLPEYNQGFVVPDVNEDEIEEYENLPPNGDWNTDVRVVLESEWPGSPLGLTYAVDTNET